MSGPEEPRETEERGRPIRTLRIENGEDDRGEEEEGPSAYKRNAGARDRAINGPREEAETDEEKSKG